MKNDQPGVHGVGAHVADKLRTDIVGAHEHYECLRHGARDLVQQASWTVTVLRKVARLDASADGPKVSQRIPARLRSFVVEEA